MINTLNESIDLEPQRPFQSEWKRKFEEQGQRCDEVVHQDIFLLFIKQRRENDWW